MGYYNNKKILTVMRRSNEILPEVEIKRIWLSYDPDSRFICINNIVSINGEGEVFYNDPTKIFINFKTSAINKAIEDEIKAGRFVIRFDYPVRYHKIKYIMPGSKFTNERPSGHGYRSYARNFYVDAKSEQSEISSTMNFMMQRLLFVTEDDIKTDRYGEKYIHKTITYLDFINRIIQVRTPEDADKYDISEITNLNSDDAVSLSNIWDGEYMSGLPMLTPVENIDPDDEQSKSKYEEFAAIGSSSIAAQLYTSVADNGLLGSIINAENVAQATSYPKYKYDPVFNMYAPTKVSVPESWSFDGILFNERPFSGLYFLQKNLNTCYIPSHHNAYILKGRAGGKDNEGSDVSAKYYIASTKARCCIIDENYANIKGDDNMWLKKFPQNEQNIQLTCKVIMDLQQENQTHIYPVFKIKITSTKK